TAPSRCPASAPKTANAPPCRSRRPSRASASARFGCTARGSTGGQREITEDEGRVRAVRRYELDAVVDRPERRGGGDPAFGDDVVEEGEQVHRPRGGVVHLDEGDVAA